MPSQIIEVAQDSDGYLWIASNDGLHRFDGYEIRFWGPGSAPARMEFVSAGPGGQVACGSPALGLFEVQGEDFVRIAPPASASTAGPRHAVFDREGSLWVSWGREVFQRSTAEWRQSGVTLDENDYPYRLAPRAEKGVLVGTQKGSIWSLTEESAELVSDDLRGRVNRLVEDEDAIFAIVRFGELAGVHRIEESGTQWILAWSERSEGLVRREGTTWAAYSTGVWALHDDGSREFITAREGMPGAGSIAVDAERGLWMRSPQGLTHVPQPDTLIWTEASGLPHVYFRSVHAVDEGYVATSWRGPLLFDRSKRFVDEIDLGSYFSRDLGCKDSWGSIWLRAFEAPDDMKRRLENARPERVSLLTYRHGEVSVRRTTNFWPGQIACDTGPDGTHWILEGNRLLNVPEAGADPVVRGELPAAIAERSGSAALEISRDGSEILALFESSDVCIADHPEEGGFVAESAWRCEFVENAGRAVDMHETDAGRMWIAAKGGGVFERRDDGWHRVGGPLESVDGAIGFSESPRGGVWVVGWSARVRVAEEDGRLVEEERLTGAHGVPDWENAFGLLDEPDGTIWLPMFSGLAVVPPQSRDRPMRAPSIKLTSLVADGRQVDPAGPVELRHGDHGLEVRWSALSFRDPTAIRYRMRIDADGEWTELSQPFVRLAGFHSGEHVLELGASLDGMTWSTDLARVTFDVAQAWYTRPWFVAATLLSLGAIAYTVYRLRLAHLLRLERQRTRIAMDLHDEMGAGLGSAGLLVGLLGQDDLDRESRAGIAAKAENRIKDLGGSLADIVWSLRPGADTLDALLLFLRQRAADLFPPGGETRLSIEAPDPCPAVPLDLPTRRNLQWIVVEALHNVARHAGAARVVLQLRPEGERWQFSIRDDGEGFDVEASREGPAGLGRESMQRRASEIDAQIDVRSQPGAGYEVIVTFRVGPSRMAPWWKR